MLGKLQKISFVLERQRFTFKKLEKFYKNKTVKSCIVEVNKLFADEIENLEKFEN